jgi:hypothetical protein
MASMVLRVVWNSNVTTRPHPFRRASGNGKRHVACCVQPTGFAVDEPVELHPPVVSIQACGADNITISSARPLTPINFQRYAYDSFGDSLRGFLTGKKHTHQAPDVVHH